MAILRFKYNEILAFLHVLIRINSLQALCIILSLLNKKNVAVNIDGYMSGIRSNSCGPKLKEEFQTPAKGEFEFFITIQKMKEG